MLSALISAAHGYAALLLTEQLPHQKCVILDMVAKDTSAANIKWLRDLVSISFCAGMKEDPGWRPLV